MKEDQYSNFLLVHNNKSLRSISFTGLIDDNKLGHNHTIIDMADDKFISKFMFLYLSEKKFKYQILSFHGKKLNQLSKNSSHIMEMYFKDKVLNSTSLAKTWIEKLKKTYGNLRKLKKTFKNLKKLKNQQKRFATSLQRV